ncbi:MAG: hypothetical protein GYB68_17025 [Chloroflexi bacterium]|nr:hypothetical protein [Chloroflexota bacterium]
MAGHAGWYNDAETIFHIWFDGDWGADEFRETLSSARADNDPQSMKPHYIIFEYKTTPSAARALSLLPEVAKLVPQSYPQTLGFVNIVPKRGFMATVMRVYRRVYASDTEFYVDSMDEALALIHAKLADPDQNA